MNVNPKAIVSKKAQLGKNVTVGAYAKINDGVVISDDCYIGNHSVIEAITFDASSWCICAEPMPPPGTTATQ
mgnify:CR=1 FL=1|tara:strand:+ start:399 stop:614 length:216 start_codon:yes stop_codon:yes gene_type:complete